MLEAVSTSLSFDCDEVPGDPVLRKTTDYRFTLGASPTINNVKAKHRVCGIAVGLLLPVGR